MADSSTTGGRIPILFSWRLLGSSPATRRYKAHPYAINIHEVSIPGGAIVRGCPAPRDSLSVTPVFRLDIALELQNLIEYYLNEL